MSDFVTWTAHGSKHGQTEVGRRRSLGLAVIVIGLVVIATGYLVLTSITAAQGRSIQDLQDEIFAVQRDNAQLEVDIANEVSMSRLMTRVSEKGFVPAGPVDFLD